MVARAVKQVRAEPIAEGEVAVLVTADLLTAQHLQIGPLAAPKKML